MPTQDLLYLSLADLAEEMEARRLSPVEVTQAALDRIQQLAPRLSAFITVTADDALEQAHQAEREMAQGLYRGPLHGVPIALKDLYATRGVLTTVGSKILKDWVPDFDATTVAKLSGAGAISVGKTNLHEFALGSTSNNPHFGTCRNPWNPDHIPGGSSGGSGVAVATGMSYMAMGTDTGGSIRSPACQNGVVGIKATYGRVSRYGVFPLSWSLDHAGPLTRTVRDAALSLQVLAGYDAKDPSSARVPVPDYTADLEKGLKGLRIGVPREFFFQECTEEVEGLVRRAITVLEELGAEVREVSLPHASLGPSGIFNIILSEGATIHEQWLRERVQEYGRDVGPRFLAGSLIPAVAYHKAQKVRALIKQEVREVMQEVDLLATASNPVTPPPIDQEMVSIRGREVWVMSLMSRLTQIHNMTGAPAITVPCGFGADGLPVGLQLAGRLFDEATVFRAAHAYEQATPWHKHRPPL